MKEHSTIYLKKRIRKKLGLNRIYCPYALFWFKTISNKSEMNCLHRLAFATNPKKKTKLRILLFYLKWPLCAFTQATEQMLLKRKSIKKHYKISSLRMWAESFYYAMFYNMPIYLYYGNMMWEPHRKKQALEVCQKVVDW
jgi:hypothetical protein